MEEKCVMGDAKEQGEARAGERAAQEGSPGTLLKGDLIHLCEPGALGRWLLPVSCRSRE